MDPRQELAEARIQEALEAGEFEDLPGQGQPLDLEAYYRTPESWRMAMSVLRSSGVVPEEVELLRERERVKARLARAADSERPALQRTLSELTAVYELKMQRYRRG